MIDLSEFKLITLRILLLSGLYDDDIVEAVNEACAVVEKHILHIILVIVVVVFVFNIFT